jgi:hypothetical protein
MLPVLTETMLATDALLVRQVQVADLWLTLASPYGSNRWLCMSAAADRPDPSELDGEGQIIRPLAACFGVRWEDLLADPERVIDDHTGLLAEVDAALGLLKAISARRESNRTPLFGNKHNVG